MDKLQHKSPYVLTSASGNRPPLVAIDGDSDWTSPSVRRKCEMIRLWGRLCQMDDNRIPYMVLKWDMNCALRYRNTWSREIKQILEECDMLTFYNIDTMKHVSLSNIIDTVKLKLTQNKKTQWHDQLSSSPKLRTYREIKHVMSCENYLICNLTLKQRSTLARFRSGTYPLALELGRYRRPVIPVEQRFCKACNLGEVEHEVHFLLNCVAYNALRMTFINEIDSENSMSSLPDDIAKFALMMNSNPKKLATT